MNKAIKLCRMISAGHGARGNNVLTYLLTYCMVQSPSWEANWFAVSREIPRISRNPKVHYRTHKHPPPVSILDQPNPVHIPTSHLLEIHPNIIHPSTPRSPQWLLPSGFPSKTLYTPLSSPTRATCQANLATKLREKWQVSWCCCFCADRSRIPCSSAHSRRSMVSVCID